MDTLSVLNDLANFGAAGLMGAMWLGERRLSRRREEQIDDAHARIARDEQRLSQLVEVVRQNTAAISQFLETQRQVADTLTHLGKEKV